MVDLTGMRVSTIVVRGVALIAGVGLLFGGLTLFAWTIGEEHFDRPDEGFDRFTAEVESLPGVSVDASERWVEAPTFSNPTSWVSVTVDQAGLRGMLDAACAAEYGDPLTWSLRVQTGSGDVVSVHTDADAVAAVHRNDSRCVDVGFDPVGLVREVDRIHLGVDVQAAIWEGDRFALVQLDADAAGVARDGGLPAALPLVIHADTLRDAAGLDAGRSVEINAADLGLVIEPAEHDRYEAVLRTLVDEHGVTSFWADGGGTPSDGVEKVQIVAPAGERAAIEAAIRTSGLHIAAFPVRFSDPAS